METGGEDQGGGDIVAGRVVFVLGQPMFPASSFLTRETFSECCSTARLPTATVMPPSSTSLRAPFKSPRRIAGNSTASHAFHCSNAV